MAIVAHNLRDGPDDFFLKPGRRYREQVYELGDESICIDKQIKSAELFDDKPPYVFLQRRPIERVVVEVLGQLVEEEAQEAGLERGDGEERPREGALRARG